jgi:hypothetical protein
MEADLEVYDFDIMEKVLVQGDLSSLNPMERLVYYTKVCVSLGLNPLTKPFDYLVLDKKLVLYAKRDCTDQLRKNHNISIAIASRERIGDIYCVTARGQMPDGRSDESIGVVSLQKKETLWDDMRQRYVPTGNSIPLTPDEMANALMKAETKAKRRVTLSLAGLGMMDESEIETVEETRIEIEDELPHQIAIPARATSSSRSRATKSRKAAPPQGIESQTQKIQQTDEKPQRPQESTNTSINVFRLLDYETGTSPRGITFVKLKVSNINTGEVETIFANTPETILLTGNIQNDSHFEMECAIENGLKTLQSLRIVETRSINNSLPSTTQGISKETYQLLDYATGTSPCGTSYARIKVINLHLGNEEVILIRNSEIIEATGQLPKGAHLVMDYTLENGFKVLNSFHIKDVAS